MRRVVQVSTILSWINLIVWGFVSLLFLLGGAVSGIFIALLMGFLLSAVPLHSYAALQLHKSVRNPAIPLGSQTPVGIRFIGFIALFFGISCAINCSMILRHPADTLALIQTQMKSVQAQMPQPKMGQTYEVTASTIRSWFSTILLLGLSVVVNVFLNFRLLRWYYFIKAGEKNEK